MRNTRIWRWAAVAGVLAACTLGATLAVASPSHRAHAAQAGATATPIKHVVVIFQENVSFDHYFGTYPQGHQHLGPAVQRGTRRRRSTVWPTRPASGARARC